MKVLSVVLLAYMLSLFLNGIVKPVYKPANNKTCHEKVACCGHKAKKQSDDCDKQGCSSLFACSNCGFLPVAALYIHPVFGHFLSKTVPLYIVGNLSAYQKPDWKPPKTC